MRGAAAVTIALLTFAAWAQTPRPEFEAATVRPMQAQTPDGGLKMSGVAQADPGMIRMVAMSLHDLVRTAYQVKDFQVEGPAWTNTERYDVTAKLPPDTTLERRHLMEQSLLADRFHLQVRRESRPTQVYALVVAKSGVKIEPAVDDPAAPGPRGFTRFHGPGHIEVVKSSFASFADIISRFVDHPVVDRTNLKEAYSFKLDFAMDPRALMMPGAAAKPPEAGDVQDLPSIFSAVQTLGLRLEPQKQPMDIIVIDHAEKTPTEN